MDADLTAALWEVAIGEEEHLSDDLRRHYQSQRDPVHFVGVRRKPSSWRAWSPRGG
jgi:hypothetical protein